LKYEIASYQILKTGYSTRLV